MPKINFNHMSKYRHNETGVQKNCDNIIAIAHVLICENLDKMSLDEKILLLDILKTIEKHNQRITIREHQKFHGTVNYMLKRCRIR